MRSLSAKNISWQGWTEKKELAKLVADEKALGPLLEFLEATEVGGREEAREEELEWEQCGVTNTLSGMPYQQYRLTMCLANHVFS